MPPSKEKALCPRCGLSAAADPPCEKCGHALYLRCDRCRKRFANRAQHLCQVTPPAHEAPSIHTPAPEEEFVLHDPPVENILKDRFRVRQVKFLPDGHMIAVLRGSGEEVALGSAWIEAVTSLLGKGKIDGDTVITLPGGPLWLTAGALLRELDPCP